MQFLRNLFRAAQLNALPHVCLSLCHYIELKDDFVNESIYNIIHDMAPNLEYIMKECQWLFVFE